MRRRCFWNRRLAVLAAALPAWLRAGSVVIDHSFGHTTTLSGPNYVVPQSAGLARGGNLFQSLKTLRLAPGESLTFTGGSTITNVLARITGGSPASINGTLRSTIPNATFYLISPGGVVFGPSAALDVKGSFVVSTADQLTFGDQSVFSTSRASADASFTSAAPAAFGFLAAKPAAVTVNGSNLSVPTRRSITVAAGSVTMTHSAGLRAPDGTVGVLSVASAATATLTPGNAPRINATAGRGAISLAQHSSLNASGEGGGRVSVIGAAFSLDHSGIEADTHGGRAGGGVAMDLTAQLSVIGGSVHSQAFAGGDAGPLRIRAGSIVASGGLFDDEIGFSTQSSVTAKGSGGAISIHAGSMQLSSGQFVAASAYGAGRSGEVAVVADHLQMTGDASDNGQHTGITTATLGSGAAGRVRVHAGDLAINNDAVIDSSTYGPGAGGAQSITAERISMSGGNTAGITGITSLCKSFSLGDAGPIAIHAGSISLQRGASITSNTFARGNAGGVQVTADHLRIDGLHSTHLTGIGSQAEAGSRGAAGPVAVHAGTVAVYHGGGISSTTFGKGNAGPVLLVAKLLRIFGGEAAVGTGVFSTSQDSATGNGGSVVVRTSKAVIAAGGGITSSTFTHGNAGDVTVTADELTVNGGSSLTGVFSNAVPGSSGNGGNVSVSASALSLFSGGQVTSNVSGAGHAGDVSVDAKSLVIDGRGNTQASQIATDAKVGSSGAAGSVIVHANSASIVAGGQVSSSTSGSGNAGAVQFVADQIKLDGRGSNNSTGIQSEAAGGKGDAGSVRVHAHGLSVLNSALLSSDTNTTGHGGDVSVTADKMLVRGTDAAGDGAFVSADCLDDGSGDAGNLSVRASSLVVGHGGGLESATTGAGNGGSVSVRTNFTTIINGGLIDSDTTGNGDAGTVKVQADQLRLIGYDFPDGTGISSDSEGSGTGRAGLVRVRANATSLRSGATISSLTMGRGNAGDVQLTGKRLLIDGRDQTFPTGITSDADYQSAGAGGSVKVQVVSGQIINGGFIGASTKGTGNAGNVQVSARNLLLDGSEQPPSFGTGIASQSQVSGGGDAGGIEVDVSHQLIVQHLAQISTSSESSGGGNERISAGRVLIRGGSINTAAARSGGDILLDAASRLTIDATGQISANSAGTARGDNGGNIVIGSTALAFLPGVTRDAISANANQGNGGNITIEPGLFLRSPGTPSDAINSSSIGGVAGRISIESPEVNLTSQIVPLVAGLTPPGIQLTPSCVVQAGSQKSSFTLEGTNGLPLTPESFKTGIDAFRKVAHWPTSAP